MDVFFEDPRYKLLCSDLKFTASSIYNRAAREVSTNQIGKLTAMTEDQLKALKRVAAVEQDHVSDLQKAKRQLAILSAKD